MGAVSQYEDAEDRRHASLYSEGRDPERLERQVRQLQRELEVVKGEHQREYERQHQRLVKQRKGHEKLLADREARFDAHRAATFQVLREVIEEEVAHDLAAVDRATKALAEAKPSKGFLGVQIGETGTADRIQAIIDDLRGELAQGAARSRRWIAEQQTQAPE